MSAEPRVILFANNRLGWWVADYLARRRENVIALVLHPSQRRRCGEEICDALRLPADRIFDASRLGEVTVLEYLKELRPSLGVSVLFGYLLQPQILGLLPAGCVNLHPGLLPYNRGAYPNVWSILERTPPGVTLHYIDQGLDTGDIIAQQRVPADITDTGSTLYSKLETAGLELFQEIWPLLRTGEVPRLPQPPGCGSAHRVRDVDAIDEIELDRKYRAGDLIDLLRARTFPPHRGAWFRHGRGKVHLELRLRFTSDEERSE